MPKIKMPKGTPSIDMTPMVDLAFLLVTFFMLATSFKEAETVKVTIPKARSVSGKDADLPQNSLVITLDATGRVYFNAVLESSDSRLQILDSAAKKYNLAITPADRDAFKKCGSFGVPIEQLPNYLRMDEVQRKKENEKAYGIPCDSLNNQIGNLTLWGMTIAFVDYKERVMKAEDEGHPFNMEQKLKMKPKISLKADLNTPYFMVKKVIKALTDKKQYHFTLVTTYDKSKSI
jgi:biopolymer transport protein ExbD